MAKDTAAKNEKRKKKELPLDFEDLANEYAGVIEYPLRKPEEDQPWAVRTVGCWVAALTFWITAITALLILGAIFE